MPIKTPTVKWDPTIGLGTVIQLGSLIVIFMLAWNAFSTRLVVIEQEHKQMAQQVRLIGKQTARIDAYMLAHNPDYLKMPRIEVSGDEDHDTAPSTTK